jgi:hypothetical protein
MTSMEVLLSGSGSVFHNLPELISIDTVTIIDREVDTDDLNGEPDLWVR